MTDRESRPDGPSRLAYAAAPCAAPFVAAGAFVALAVWAADATAQDFGIGPQKEPTLTTSRVGLESSYATFDLQGVHGQYFGLTARGDLRLAHSVGLRVLVPAYEIALSEQSASAGLGDAELRVRYLIFDGHPWRFYGGVAEQLPTGNTSIGLGQGGSQISPYVTGGFRKGPVVVYASISDCIGLHPQGKPEPADYVDPSSDHELRSNLGFIGEISEPVYVGAALSAITDLVPNDVGTTLLIGGLAVGYLVSERFKLVILGQLPLAGEHRFDEKLGLNAYLYF